MTGKTGKEEENVHVNPVDTYPKFISLKVGDCFHIPFAEDSCADAAGKAILWHSQDDTVARVHPTGGYIYAIGPGDTRIYATAEGGSYSDCLFVIVTGTTFVPSHMAQPRENALVSSIRISPKTRTIALGRFAYFHAEVFPKEAANRQVIWSSDDPHIATVNSVTGFVCTRNVGMAVIRATAQDGSGVVGKCKLRVKPHSRKEGADGY